MVKYEAAIKEVDVSLSVSGGDSGKGPKKQKTEITIYTFRNGVVGLLIQQTLMHFLYGGRCTSLGRPCSIRI